MLLAVATCFTLRRRNLAEIDIGTHLRISPDGAGWRATPIASRAAWRASARTRWISGDASAPEADVGWTMPAASPGVVAATGGEDGIADTFEIPNRGISVPTGWCPAIRKNGASEKRWSARAHR